MTEIEEQAAREAAVATLDVRVPAVGEFLVRNGRVLPVEESELQEYAEDSVGWLVWVKRDGD